MISTMVLLLVVPPMMMIVDTYYGKPTILPSSATHTNREGTDQSGAAASECGGGECE